MPIARFVKQRRVRRGSYSKPRFSKQRRNWRGTTKVALAPTVTSIAPTTAVAGAADLTVTLTGTNFTTVTRATVNGGQVATTYVSATSITCVVPATMMLSAITLQIGAITGQLVAPVTRALTITPAE